MVYVAGLNLRMADPGDHQWRLGLEMMLRVMQGDGDTLAALNCCRVRLPFAMPKVPACGDAGAGDDTLAALNCAEGQVPVRNAEGAWACTPVWRWHGDTLATL